MNAIDLVAIVFILCGIVGAVVGLWLAHRIH